MRVVVGGGPGKLHLRRESVPAHAALAAVGQAVLGHLVLHHASHHDTHVALESSRRKWKEGGEGNMQKAKKSYSREVGGT